MICDDEEVVRFVGVSIMCVKWIIFLILVVGCVLVGIIWLVLVIIY